MTAAQRDFFALRLIPVRYHGRTAGLDGWADRGTGAKMDKADKDAQRRRPAIFPGIARLHAYTRAAATADLVAGLIIAVLLVPQAIAYAQLAGLPPQMGLYAAALPPLVYALLGSSPSVSVGPSALVSLLVADALARAALPPPTAAAMLAAEVGALLLLLGIFRLGRLVNFVSDPALQGFMAGAAVLIGFSQLPAFLGVEALRAATLVADLRALAPYMTRVHLPTLAVGAAALLALQLGGRFAPATLWRLGVRPPWRTALAKCVPLIVLMGAALVTAALPLGIATAPRPSQGLPVLPHPPLGAGPWIALLPSAAVIAIVIFVNGSAVSKSLAGRRRQSLDTSREAIALGAGNVAAAVSGGYPVDVSMSRSALAYDSNAATPFASAIAGLVVLVVAMFFAAALAYLPRAALSALVIGAVFGLVKPAAIRSTFGHSRAEGAILILTFLATTGFGVQWGLAAGALLGIANFLWFSSMPRITRLGYQADARHYRSVDRAEVEVDSLPVLVLRIDRSLYFANVGRCEDEILRLIARHPAARALLVDMKGVNEIDASGIAMLERLIDHLEEKRLAVAFAVVKTPLHRYFERSNDLRPCRIYEDVEAGVDALKAELDRIGRMSVEEVAASAQAAGY